MAYLGDSWRFARDYHPEVSVGEKHSLSFVVDSYLIFLLGLAL